MPKFDVYLQFTAGYHNNDDRRLLYFTTIEAADEEDAESVVDALSLPEAYSGATGILQLT